MDGNMIVGIISGVLTGGIYAISGWQKSGQTFNWGSFLETFLPCLIMGGIGGWYGSPIEAIASGPLGAGLKKIVKNIINLFQKKTNSTDIKKKK
jgi:hypothetical protein